MVDYRVYIDEENKTFVIDGVNIASGSKLVELPRNSTKGKKMYKQYISLFLNKRDLEAAIDYVQLISPNNTFRANEAFFIASLSTYFKCFQNSRNRIRLERNEFIRSSPESTVYFDRFEAMRNKHFIHDENMMVEACAFMIIAPEDCEEKFSGPPSVIWNLAPVDYIKEGNNLHNLMQITLTFVSNKIDSMGNKIQKEHENLSHEKLLSLKEPTIRRATNICPEEEREHL